MQHTNVLDRTEIRTTTPLITIAFGQETADDRIISGPSGLPTQAPRSVA